MSISAVAIQIFMRNPNSELRKAGFSQRIVLISFMLSGALILETYSYLDLDVSCLYMIKVRPPLRQPLMG
jgi:hypothetical protein